MGLATLLAVLSIVMGNRELAAQEAPALTAPWLRNARVVGARLSADMTASVIERDLAELAAQNVSVVEADSNLSDFLTEPEFEAELRFMRQYVQTAHRLGLKVVWYVSTLEVLSAQGEKTVSKLHPDWLQRGLDGKPNVYLGQPPGTLGSVHWVGPGSESAWMSVHSGYADVFLERIKRIAATGLDGIWLDVPLYSEMVYFPLRRSRNCRHQCAKMQPDHLPITICGLFHGSFDDVGNIAPAEMMSPKAL